MQHSSSSVEGTATAAPAPGSGSATSNEAVGVQRSLEFSRDDGDVGVSAINNDDDDDDGGGGDGDDDDDDDAMGIGGKGGFTASGDGGNGSPSGGGKAARGGEHVAAMALGEASLPRQDGGVDSADPWAALNAASGDALDLLRMRQERQGATAGASGGAGTGGADAALVGGTGGANAAGGNGINAGTAGVNDPPAGNSGNEHDGGANTGDRSGDDEPPPRPPPAAVEGEGEVERVAAGKGATSPATSVPVQPKLLKPATRRRVDELQIAKLKEYGDHQLDLELQRQVLEQGAQQLVLREEVKRRARRVSRADAVQEDERLGALPTKQVLSELTGPAPASSSPSQRAGRGSSGVSLDAFVAARKAAAESAQSPAAGTAAKPKAAELLSALRTRWDPEEGEGAARGSRGAGLGTVDAGDASEDGGSLTQGPVLPAIATNVRLDDLVSALRHDLPAQEVALQSLKTRRGISAVRLGWARRRGSGAEDDDDDEEEKSGPRRRPLLLLDVRGRELRRMSLEIIEEVLDRVMSRLAFRPSREQVAAEVAAWRAAEPGALASVARHLAEGLTHEVVDELIAEAYDEIRHLKKVADSFAFDMLVEAVAFSQRKYVFGSGEDGVRARLRDAAAQQDANLARSLAAKRATATSRNLTRTMTLNSRAPGGAASAAGGPSSGGDGGGPSGGGDGGGGDDIDTEQYSSYSSRAVAQPPPPGIKLGDALSEDLDEEAIYVMHREFNDTNMARDEKQLYLQGLKAMLQEMRLRRGDAPYGHTQQLSVYWPPYVRITRVQRLAAQRVRPPLAAGPAVWRHLQRDPLSRVGLGLWPGPDCAVAAQRERIFWSQVALRPTYLTAKNTPMVQVFQELGPITALSASPNGAFLAVGTAPGAMLVFNMRNKPVAPWFQVLGDGQTYKRPWFRRKKPRNPALVAFAWSADSYQLASLDASSTLRMWWMRPEPGSNVKEDPGRQPVAPELILSLGPMSVAITGKAPVLEPILEEQLLGLA
ncbi:hypothetical protein Vafri_9442, partial [Volvox africanus]